MRVVRVPLRDLEPGRRALPRDTGHYVARVLRLRVGEAFVAFDPHAGHEADARLIAAAGEVTVELGPLRPARVAAARPVTWIQGLAKGDKCDAIVRDATELGATRVVLTPTLRSVVRLEGARSAARLDRWTRVAEEAARQCGRGDPPEIALAESLEDALAEGGAARFFLWERATVPLGPALAGALGGEDSLVFAAGPEGGFADHEADLAGARGFALASLGPIVLRTETVCAAVLGAVLVGGAGPVRP